MLGNVSRFQIENIFRRNLQSIEKLQKKIWKYQNRGWESLLNTPLVFNEIRHTKKVERNSLFNTSLVINEIGFKCLGIFLDFRKKIFSRENYRVLINLQKKISEYLGNFLWTLHSLSMKFVLKYSVMYIDSR